MRHIKNPFVSGGKVAGQAFWNREKEIKELAGDIRSGQHVILLAQRRLGKTSLVCKVLEEVRKEGIVPVYVDLYPVSTLRELIEAYAKVIAGALSTFSKAVELMRDLFSRLHRTMGVDAAGNLQWSVGFDKEMEMETFDEVASALDAYLQGKNKRGVVVFDEFQQIVELGGEKMERRLRSAIQHQQQVTYVFVGSRKHMLEDLFSNPNRPFYRSGKIFPLLRIERERLYEYVKERFAEAEVAIADGVPDLVAEVTECHPYYTQYLCHVLYDVMENRRIEVDDIPNAVALLLRRESAAYMNIWDLLTQRQRQTLMILSETGTESPFRPEVLRQYDISQPSVVLRAIQSLKDKDLVDGVNGGYEITDLFFKKWIKKHISGTA